MADKTGIANQALYLVGADPIDTFNDESTESDLMSVIYEPNKKSVLRSYPWNCATRRVALTESSDTPINEFDHQFLLPDDNLRVLEVWVGDYNPHADYNGERAYSVEGNLVLTNDTAVTIRYIKNITEAEMDTHVEETVVAKLAFKCSFTLNNSNTSQAQFGNIFEATLEESRTTDSLEQSMITPSINGLTRVRR